MPESTRRLKTILSVIGPFRCARLQEFVITQRHHRPGAGEGNQGVTRNRRSGAQANPAWRPQDPPDGPGHPVTNADIRETPPASAAAPTRLRAPSGRCGPAARPRAVWRARCATLWRRRDEACRGDSVPGLWHGPATGDWLSGRAPRSHRGGHWFDPSIAHDVRPGQRLHEQLSSYSADGSCRRIGSNLGDRALHLVACVTQEGRHVTGLVLIHEVAADVDADHGHLLTGRSLIGLRGAEGSAVRG